MIAQSTNRTLARLAAVAVTLGAGAGLLAEGQQRAWPPPIEPAKASAPVLPPAEALRTFAMPPGYRVELVASEPLIQDPILIDWDPAGRMWAVELPGYMRDIKASGEYDPLGRIVVLEDADGNGTMDRRTVFADGLIQPRALKVLDDGVLVGEPPNIWVLRDTDGDLKSDRKDLVTGGYGRRETNVEVNANALLWGLDNRIYMAGTGGDMVLRYVDRVFTAQKSLSRGQWGAAQDDSGRIYRNHNESVLHVDLIGTPYFARNPALLRTRGSHEALQDPAGHINDIWPAHQTPATNRAYQHGVLRPDGTLAAYTAACAPTVYRGDRLPVELSGNVFVAEPTANVVSRFVVTDDGATLRARKAYQRAEFLTSTDERFRPVHLSNAPDGTLYIVDMYRGIIQHHAYITEYLRDQIVSRGLEQPVGLGRIYRVVHEGTTRDRMTLARPAETSQLVSLLSHPNGWWRDAAQQLLVQRGDRIAVPALTTLAATAAGWRTRLHALWTLDGLGATEPAVVQGALGDRSRDVRAAAIRMAERWLGEAGHPLQAPVLALVNDPDWAVRQQAAASIGLLPAGVREGAIADLLERFGTDPVMTDSALSGIRGAEPAVLSRLLRAGGGQSPARDAAIAMVAATIVRAAQGNEIDSLFDAIGDTARSGWQRAAVLRGTEIAVLGAAMPGSANPSKPAAPANANAPCATCPGGRGGPGGAYAFPRPADWPAAAARGTGPAVRLSRQPRSLIALAGRNEELSARAAAVLARLSWPGKPGESSTRALSGAEQERFERGRAVYRNVCQGCHQPDGRGLDRIAPSLVGSPFALAASEITIRILMNGKEGVTGLMPPVGGALDDEQIASVLTYVRREWGHSGDPVEPGAVAAIRSSSAGRTRPWTEAELNALGTGRSGRLP